MLQPLVDLAWRAGGYLLRITLVVDVCGRLFSITHLYWLTYFSSTSRIDIPGLCSAVLVWTDSRDTSDGTTLHKRSEVRIHKFEKGESNGLFVTLLADEGSYPRL